MARTKTVKMPAKVKTSRKSPAAVTSKKVPDNGHAEEIQAEVRIKQFAGTIRAVMSLPPPTGRPPKPPGKSPRIADRAAIPHKPVEKRNAGPKPSA